MSKLADAVVILFLALRDAGEITQHDVQHLSRKLRSAIERPKLTIEDVRKEVNIYQKDFRELKK